MNKIKLRVNQIKDGVYDPKMIFPLGQTYDEVGREDLIQTYEDETIDKLVGIKKDYEVARYTHYTIIKRRPKPLTFFYNFNFGTMVNSNPSTFITLFPTEPQVNGSWGSNPPCPPSLQDYYPDNSTNTIYQPYDPNIITDWYGYDFQNFTPEETYKNNKSFTKSFQIRFI